MGEEEITVDSRPSDAIALALRAGAPIFVDDDVVRRAKNVETVPKEADDQEKLKEWLENLKPEDFGRYKM
jgi:bifunctional DNase/RNase